MDKETTFNLQERKWLDNGTIVYKIEHGGYLETKKYTENI